MTKIHLVNSSAVPFGGWQRCNVDVLPPHPRGTFSDQFRYILGNKSGADTWNLDIYCGLGPGERKVLDLTQAEPMDYDPLSAYMRSPAGMWGGISVSVAGVQLEFLGTTANGAAFDGHWHGRIGALIHVDLHVHWYPDDPRWCYGEILIDASNPAVADVKQFIPDAFLIEFGDADVLVPGHAPFDWLMSPGDWLADGQARALSFVLCWPRHGGDQALAQAIADRLIEVNGLRNLHHCGNPPVPVNFNAEAWANEMRAIVIPRQHDWFNSPLDQSLVSGAAGAQGSQPFGLALPAMVDPLAVGPIYLAGLDASWPMFHLETDGSQLDWKAHPGLRLYYGKVNTGISSDWLGKTGFPSGADSHGQIGPEDEHWFLWTEIAANRFKGTPGTQWVLRGHAIQFLFRWVVEPPGAWLTANRGIGYMLFLAAELYRGLADRELAEAVKARTIAVFDQLIQPLWGGAWWSWIEWPRSAAIGGTADGPARAIPWQACVFCLGLDWAGEVLGHEGMRGYAHGVSAEILGRIYEKHGTRWRCRDVITYDGSDPGPYFDGYFWFGSPMAVACLLRHDPQHAGAREIWQQMLNDNPDYQQCSWLCPGIQVTP